MVSFLARLGLAAAVIVVTSSSAKAQQSFDWTAISPSSGVDFHPCYEVFQCARLSVPMDWLAYDNGRPDNRTVDIAITMLPAVVPANDSSYAGPIFTNPGGPGHSGVDYVRGRGLDVQSVVDTPGERHYDIVGFDPRGVGATTPAINCFPDDPLARAMMNLDIRSSYSNRATMNSHLPYAMTAARAFGERCGRMDHLPYISTASVARDIVAMADKMYELRNGVTRRSFSPAKRTDSTGTKARVNFIGFSYGAILGNYLASMFPDRMGRIILDGVADADDYTTGPGWTTNLEDTDRVYRMFFEGCFNHPDTCALARPEDSSPQDIQDRVNAYLADLDKEPVYVNGPAGSPSPSFIATGTDLRSIMGNVFYTPVNREIGLGYTGLALELDKAISRGELELLARLYYPEESAICGSEPGPETVPADEALTVMVCMDGEDISGRDMDFYQDWLNDRVNQSDILGQEFAKIRLPCAGWTTRPSWDFNGPFTTPEADLAEGPGKPAAPILFLSPQYDPVTPLSSARKMSEGHPGSRVVVVEGSAHSTMNTIVSECRDNIVREYMRTGEVPEEQETVCEADCSPWDLECNP